MEALASNLNDLNLESPQSIQYPGAEVPTTKEILKTVLDWISKKKARLRFVFLLGDLCASLKNPNGIIFKKPMQVVDPRIKSTSEILKGSSTSN